ncbi:MULTISPECIES: LLM class flavin-dependent oxidoreductase [Cupriavidus]
MDLTLSVAGYGHHPAAWRVSTLAASSPGFPRYAEAVRRAQSCGFDGVFFAPGEAPGNASDASGDGRFAAFAPDPLPLAGSLIAQVPHIGLGAAVVLAHTEPFHTARAFSVLDGLSAGRTALLCDLRWREGGDPAFAHARPLSREAHYERAGEYLEVLAKLWDSWEEGAVLADKEAGQFADAARIHPIHHVGTHFSVRGPLTAVRPVQGHPVMAFNDASAHGLALAARFGDVFLAECASPQEMASLRGELRALAQQQGRPAGALRVLATLSVVLADSDEAAAQRKASLDALAPRPAAAMPGYGFVGSAARLRELMDSWHAAGICDGFNVAPAVLSDDLERLASEVVPRLQGRSPADAARQAAPLRDRLGLARPVNRFSEVSVHG